jgi:hypothetical protein
MSNFVDTYIPIDAPDYVGCTTYVVVNVSLPQTGFVEYKNGNQSLYVQVSTDAFQKEVLTITQAKPVTMLKTSQLVKADKVRAYRIIGEFLDVVSKSPKDAPAAKKKSKKK